MNYDIKSVYGVMNIFALIRFIAPYLLTGNFKTLMGDKIYFFNGCLHREDGPAIEFANGTKYWSINGHGLEEAEFNKYVRKHNGK